MTLQQMFTKAVKGLASQEWKQSIDSYGSGCLYRGPNGLKCAIGWCIPDRKYVRDMDGWMGLDGVLESLRVAKKNTERARELQHAHDNARGPKDMQNRFRRFGKKHSLKWPVGV